MRILLCAAVIACGLALRRYGFGVGLPSLAVKYGGSVLWATMMLLLVAIIFPHLSRWSIASVSAAIAVGVELLRLVHAPWLDPFRLTLAAALLFGRIFSLWDIAAYGAGIGLGIPVDRVAAPAPEPTQSAS